MRLPLPGGQWVELRDRLTYGQGRAVRAALLATNGQADALTDLDIVLVRSYVSAWQVLDLAGSAVPLDQPELAPDDIIQAVSLKCLELWRARPDPKGMIGSSDTTPPGQP